MNKILIIEDDPEVARLIQVALKPEGYAYEHAKNGKEAFSLITIFNPDVLLLDLMLPDIDGMTIIKRVRQSSRVPIIVISARDEDIDKVTALDLGADDYLTKPFSIDELLARVRVALRRVAREAQSGPDSLLSAASVYHNGALTIDFAAQSVKMNEEEIHLTPMEYKVLVTLAKNTSRVLTHHYLLKQVWGNDSIEDTSSLRVTMATLRHKLEKDTHETYIKTHIGVGYQMLQVPKA